MYFFIRFFINGITSLPCTSCESAGAHIPFAQSLLDGTIFQNNPSYFYPVSAEIILAFFIALHIPLNLFNVLGVVLLFLSIYILGTRNNFSKGLSFMLAFSVCTIYNISRDVNSQLVDIYLLIFYTASLICLQKPKKNLLYFVTTGFFLGMLIGSKYSAPFYTLFLIIIYGKGLLKKMTPTYMVVFLIPIFAFGLSWYIRNYVNFQNPFYPQHFLFFKGEVTSPAYEWPYWKIALYYPKELLDTLISDYMVWIVPSILILPFTIYLLVKKGMRYILGQKLLLLCVLNLVFFFLLPAPASHSYNAIVFGIRYSYPALLLIIFLAFSFAQTKKMIGIILLIAFINTALLLLPYGYHPKLNLIIISLIFTALYSLRFMFGKQHWVKSIK